MLHTHITGHRPRSRLRAAFVAAGAALLTLGTMSSASAAPEGYEEVDVGVGRLYGGFDYGVLLFTHDSIEDICMGAPEPIAAARMFERADGSLDFKISSLTVPIYLYYTDMDGFDFLDMNCAAIFDGDPTTVPAEYFAVGEANLKERVSIAPNGDEAHFNGVNGVATGTDGTVWKVRTWADFSVVDGMYVGDPADFQGISVHKIGP